MRPPVLVPVVVLLALPSAAAAQTGGSAAPSGSGGVEYGQVGLKPPTSRSARLVASEFSLSPERVESGAPVTFAYRVDGRDRSVRIFIDLVREGTRHATVRVRLGYKRTNQRLTRTWQPAAGELPEGRYVARLHATARDGRKLARSASTNGRAPLEVTAPGGRAVLPAPVPGPAPVASAPNASGVFPVNGPFDFGGEDARFGAKRHGHIHRGQDIMAAEGTPVVSPRAGFVYFKAYQASGAGHYLVVRADDGRDYVFMHLVSGSIPVGKGDPVRAGHQIGKVGTTGSTSAAHLHFEIWPNGWYAENSQPIDPLPDLKAWAGQ